MKMGTGGLGLLTLKTKQVHVLTGMQSIALLWGQGGGGEALLEQAEETRIW